jgi:hypothetical protein
LYCCSDSFLKKALLSLFVMSSVTVYLDLCLLALRELHRYH